MNLIVLDKISKSYSEKILINNISLGINTGDKIGLIGVNGTGKSTLLKILVGEETPDNGAIIKSNRLRINYLSQNQNYKESSTVIEQVFNSNSKELNLIEKYNKLLELSKETPTENINLKLLQTQDQIDSLNLWDLESSAKSILTRLGIHDFLSCMGNLSGGQKKRVSLASTLITPCDLLILDEPTNHLDNDTINWLEEYLNSWKGSLLMITHDRYFLDNVTNRIIELDNGNLYNYLGNYSKFLELKSERIVNKSTIEDKRKRLIKTELKWVKRGALARSTKQKARLNRFEELKNQDDIKKEENIDISVSSNRLGRKVIEINEISKSYNGKKIIDNFSYSITRNDRIGIIGKNGIGKSTLIDILHNTIKPDTGSIDVGDTIKIGYFAQDDSHMNTSQKAIDYVKETSDYIETSDGYKISASQMCEKFLFDSTMQHTQIARLSGGERRRLHLLKILMSAPNVLLMDEPTNDLDINTLNILEDYLDTYKGVIITVSHDRYFLDRICNKIFAYEGNGKIYIFTGNYSDYIIYKEIQNIKFEESNEKNIQCNKSKTEKPKQHKKLKLSYNEQREFENIESEIEKIESKLQLLEDETSKYSTDFSKLQNIIDEKTKLEDSLSLKYDRWEYLNELVEKLNNEK